MHPIVIPFIEGKLTDVLFDILQESRYRIVVIQLKLYTLMTTV